MDLARVLFGRVIRGRSEKSILLTGLRGVGKTVLLNEMEMLAQDAGYSTIMEEAHADKPLSVLLAQPMRKLLYSLDRQAGAGHKARQGLAILKSFLSGIRVHVGEIDIGLDVEPEVGSADSGDLEVDLPDLFSAIAEAAQERRTAVAVLIDEIQYLSAKELSALIMAMHKMQQRQLPLVLVGAGLPILPGLAGNSKSYAERLFQLPRVGPLNDSDAAQAIREPIENAGKAIRVSAVKEICRQAAGYPYFLQEWGYQAWNESPKSPISLADVQGALGIVTRRLDENFFRVRFDRLTPKEKEYLRAMAEFDPGPYRSSEIAGLLGKSLSGLGPARARLIEKGMVYSPVHGEMAFSVPMFGQFLKRAMPTP
jgi:hypothetical protein